MRTLVAAWRRLWPTVVELVLDALARRLNRSVGAASSTGYWDLDIVRQRRTLGAQGGAKPP